MQEYLAVAKLPDITDAEERDIDTTGATRHHRVWVRPVYIRATVDGMLIALSFSGVGFLD